MLMQAAEKDEDITANPHAMQALLSSMIVEAKERTLCVVIE